MSENKEMTNTTEEKKVVNATQKEKMENIIKKDKEEKEEMDTRKRATIIGIGNCGNQIASLAERKYHSLFNAIYINSSDTDLKMVSTAGLKYKIGKMDKENNVEEAEGSGKNRSRMKEYLRKDLHDIIDDIEFKKAVTECKYVFVVVSAAGGTGSGAGPIFMELLKSLFVDQEFILIAVLPRMGASLLEHGNTLEFLDELYTKLNESTTYMVYDNETTSDLPATVSLTTVNENIVEDIRVLTGIDNYPTPYESIDGADMESIITTPGRLLVTRVKSNLSEKEVEDGNIGDMIVKSCKKSCHAEIDRNKRVIRWGIITFFTEAVNKLYNSELTTLQEFIGIPIERFNHNAINKGKEEFNFIYMIASGLSPINDRVKRIRERVEQLKEALPSEFKYDNDNETISYNVMEERRKLDKKDAAEQKMSIEDIFSKF